MTNDQSSGVFLQFNRWKAVEVESTVIGSHNFTPHIHVINDVKVNIQGIPFQFEKGEIVDVSSWKGSDQVNFERLNLPHVTQVYLLLPEPE